MWPRSTRFASKNAGTPHVSSAMQRVERRELTSILTHRIRFFHTDLI